MRVQITRVHPGEMDGISLGFFEVGITYDVSTSLGSYLVTMGCADPVIGEDSDHSDFDTETETAIGVNQDRRADVAADPHDVRLSNSRKRSIT